MAIPIDRRKLILGLLGVVALGLLAAGAYFLITQQVGLSSRAGAETSLSLSPASGTVEIGKNTQIVVGLTTSAKIVSTKVTITFDRSAMKLVGAPVVDKRLGKILKRTAVKVANTKGQVTVETKAPGKNGIGGTGTLFSLKFQGTSPNSAATVSFDSSSMISDDKGGNILSGAKITGGSYLVVEKNKGKDPICDSFTVSPTSGSLPLSVTATIAARPGKKPITKYIFNFEGTDAEGTSSTTQHTFNNAGSFEAKGKVTDSAGNSSDFCSAPVEVATGNSGEDQGGGSGGSGGSDSGGSGSGGGSDSGGSGGAGGGGDRGGGGNGGDRGGGGSDNSGGTGGGTGLYDCNNDGEINILDYTCFRNAYGKKKDSASGNWQ